MNAETTFDARPFLRPDLRETIGAAAEALGWRRASLFDGRTMAEKRATMARALAALEEHRALHWEPEVILPG